MCPIAAEPFLGVNMLQPAKTTTYLMDRKCVSSAEL